MNTPRPEVLTNAQLDALPIGTIVSVPTSKSNFKRVDAPSWWMGPPYLTGAWHRCSPDGHVEPDSEYFDTQIIAQLRVVESKPISITARIEITNRRGFSQLGPMTFTCAADLAGLLEYDAPKLTGQIPAGLEQSFADLVANFEGGRPAAALRSRGGIEYRLEFLRGEQLKAYQQWREASMTY